MKRPSGDLLKQRLRELRRLQRQGHPIHVSAWDRERVAGLRSAQEAGFPLKKWSVEFCELIENISAGGRGRQGVGAANRSDARNLDARPLASPVHATLMPRFKTVCGKIIGRLPPGEGWADEHWGLVTCRKCLARAPILAEMWGRKPKPKIV